MRLTNTGLARFRYGVAEKVVIGGDKRLIDVEISYAVRLGDGGKLLRTDNGEGHLGNSDVIPIKLFHVLRTD